MSDLISRQGALAKIRTRLQDWAAYGNEEYRRGLYACEDMILSLPSAEPNKTMKGSDLISRADAIDAVWKIVPVETEIDSTLLDKAEVIVELSVLPSAEAVQGWIPCSERLPDERQDVYVTVLWDDYGDYITAYGMRTRFGWHLHSNADGELIKGYTVIAWMPLPEPYKEEDNERA